MEREEGKSRKLRMENSKGKRTTFCIRSCPVELLTTISLVELYFFYLVAISVIFIL